MTFAYDPLGNMLTAERGGAEMSLTYDKAGRKLTMDDPDMGFWQYDYDALGNMTWQNDARGCILTIEYDVLNRPTSKSSSGAGCGTQVNTSYTYGVGTNGKGRRTSMSVTGADYTQWTYDVRGRVLSENKQITGGGQFVTSFTYNSADLPITMTYPDAEAVTFTYNNNMLPTSVIGADTYAQSITYDSANRMIQLVRGANKINTVFTYNSWNVDGGRLLNLTSTQVSTGDPLQNLTYDYDPVGNILTITDSLSGPQTQTFTYDELDRLTSSTVSGGTDGLYAEDYTYDSATGNLAGKGGVTYAYDASHAHAVSSLSNGNTYTYDANGNMTTRHVGSQTFTLTYDAENRLVSVSGAATASFVYDGDGKQVKATVNGTTTVYVGNHYEVKNGVISKYYFAGSTRLAVRANGTLRFLLGDHLGSSSVTTNANGVKTASALYKSFGETRYSFGDLNTDYKFTGQREEASLGIYFFQARWYDGSLGRFLSPDTIVPTSTQGTQAWDRYAFVNNNPVRYTDPTGHTACNLEPEECKFIENSQNGEGGSSSGGAGGSGTSDTGGGGASAGQACTGQYQSVLCLPTPTSQSLLLPPLQLTTQTGAPSYEGLSNSDIDALLLWWNSVALPFNDFLSMYDAYQLYSKGGWKTATMALPTGPLEAIVAALAQGYKDSWYQSLSPLQRMGRMVLVGGETYLTDAASTLGGVTGGAGGTAIGGPVGAFIGYGAGAVTVSAAGNKFWSNTVNPWLVPALGLGIWP